MKSIFLIITILSWSMLGVSQTGALVNLTLEEAVNLALQQNKSIQLQALQVKQVQQQVSRANTGALPTVNVLGTATYANNFSEVDLRTFQLEPSMININEGGVQNLNLNLGVQLDYLLYDGGRSGYRYELLEGQARLQVAQQKVVVEDIVVAVTELYLEISKLQTQANFLSENVAINETRIQKIKDRKQFGKATGLDIMVAQTNANEDVAALEEVNLVIENLQQDLSLLMGERTNQQYILETNFTVNPLPTMEEIQADIKNNNSRVALSQEGIVLSRTEVKLNEADRAPVLSSFVNAGVLYQRNDVQQLAKLRNIGATIGLSANYNLFDGGARKLRTQKAKLQVEIGALQTTELVDRLISQSKKERSTIEFYNAQLLREESNLVTANETFKRLEDRYQNGKANALSLREVQLVRLNTQLRIDELRINLLQAYLKLDQLRGRLVK